MLAPASGLCCRVAGSSQDRCVGQPALTSHLPLYLQMAPPTGSALLDSGSESRARHFLHGCRFLVFLYLIQPGLRLGGDCPGSVWGQGLGCPLCHGDQHSRSLRLQRPSPLPASTSFDLIMEGELIIYKLALLFNTSVLSGLTPGTHQGPGLQACLSLLEILVIFEGLFLM